MLFNLQNIVCKLYYLYLYINLYYLILEQFVKTKNVLNKKT